MTPFQTFDPRDPWAPARRIEIYRYAQELGHKDIVEAMPKDLMVARLKDRGVPPPAVPPRPIGANVNARSGDTTRNSHHYSGQQPQPVAVQEMSAAEVLERDWQASQPKPIEQMTINELRDACKKRSIKLKRTDKMDDLRAKLKAHG